MARPKLHPSVRFNSEITYWQLAVQRGSLALPVANATKAIHLMHRLNMCRAAYRDLNPERTLPWDNYVVRPKGSQVTITLKEDLVDIAAITDIDGNPLTTADWEATYAHPLEQVQPAPVPKTPKLTMPAPPETFDNTKPLDLDVADE
jgi:hypothetical protein